MINNERINIEIENENKKVKSFCISNPITTEHNHLEQMVKKIIENEIPKLKNNSLLYNMVVYSLKEDMKTVQSLKNVLSYIKGTNVKDVKFRKGEVFIKCLE